MSQRTTKAVILARGLGSRMQAPADGVEIDAGQARVAATGIKGMIPLGRPFLDYVISALADAGITDVCLVIGPEHAAVQRYYESLHTARIRVHFTEQAFPLGTANAVAAAERFAGRDMVLVLNSDNYYPVAAYRALIEVGVPGLIGFRREALVAQGNVSAERIRGYALAESDEMGALTHIVEKPDEAAYARLADRSLVSMNLWSFPPSIFEACRRVQPSERGELELQDAVRIAMLQLGVRFTVIPFEGGVLDLSSRRDIPAVAAALAGLEVRL